MRCADLGPTPGRHRKAAMSSSSDDEVFISFEFEVSSFEVQVLVHNVLHNFKPETRNFKLA
jgi:hypothetical protein